MTYDLLPVYQSTYHNAFVNTVCISAFTYNFHLILGIHSCGVLYIVWLEVLGSEMVTVLFIVQFLEFNPTKQTETRGSLCETSFQVGSLKTTETRDETSKRLLYIRCIYSRCRVVLFSLSAIIP